MSRAVELTGAIASDGIFMGPVLRLDRPKPVRSHWGSPETEAQLLAGAVTAACDDIAGLIAAAEDAAADLLGFQLALLEDDVLLEPVRAAILAGAAADTAWAAAVDAEIAGYEASPDEYFRARSADLKDVRDRVLRHILGEDAAAAASGAVLVGEDLAPTRFVETDWTKGGAIALWRGSTTSHVAMLARGRGIPMIVNLGAAAIDGASEALVDAMTGRVVFDPPSDLKAEYEGERASLKARREQEAAFLMQPARRRDGTAVDLLINVAGVDELDHIAPGCCDGIGLMRSEFLFADGKPLPGEDEQYRAYRRLVEWAEGRPVTIRTLDVGGDKPIAGLTLEHESNPFLGLRGVRLTLAHKHVFKTQLRALARAAAHGPLKIMIPMVTVPDELKETAALLDQCIAALQHEGKPCARPQLGIMVEVPAVAACPELFSAADFFSIGSNDLTQYVTACSRGDASVAALFDPAHPAVLRFIANVVRYGKYASIPVSLCGDMASDPQYLRQLLDAGLTSLSVAPARVGRIKVSLADI